MDAMGHCKKDEKVMRCSILCTIPGQRSFGKLLELLVALTSAIFFNITLAAALAASRKGIMTAPYLTSFRTTWEVKMGPGLALALMLNCEVRKDKTRKMSGGGDD